MRSTVSRKSVILMAIIAVVIGTVGFGAAYLYGKSSERGESVKQYLVTEDIEPGHSLKGKYKEFFVSSKTSVDLSNLVVNANDLDSAVASTKLYKNSPITLTSITKLEELDRTVEFSFPIGVSGSVANSLQPGDVVAVKLTYKDSTKDDAVVISRIKIKDVKSTSGTPVEDNKTLVGYVIADVSNKESSDINNAMKEGTLYCIKYTDLNQKPMEKTYKAPEGTSDLEKDKDKDKDTASAQ